MSNVMTSDYADLWYRKAELRAASYLAALQAGVKDKTYVPILAADIQAWKKNHIKRRSWLSILSRTPAKPDLKDYSRYLRWQKQTGNLDDYLDRSVTYMYMRDLGKDLAAPDTSNKIKNLVSFIKNHLIQSATSGSDTGKQPDYMSLAGLYRWAQKEGIETAMIWAIDKLRSVSAQIPVEMNAEHAVRKLIKIIIGVTMHVLDDMDDTVSPAERSRRLDEAIRLGYSYGLTYPFIDDLLDSGVLQETEKEQYSGMIRHTLLHGSVPDVKEWTGTNIALIQFVHAELREAFETIKRYQSPETLPAFYEQTYVFFESQDMDRAKNLAYDGYSNEELFLPIIIKSSSSRLIVRSVIGAAADETFDERTFYYGIYNQLADDFADMHDDMKDGAVTPYTYYLKYHAERSDLVNPYEMYWAVIAHLIHHVYRSNAKAREVILDRAINGLKRFKARAGAEKYAEIMGLFASGHPEFASLIEQMVRKADRVDFFDKLLRDQLVTVLRNNRSEKETFAETVRTVRKQINDLLPISKDGVVPLLNESLIDASNYSLEGSGKRIRPVVAWVMCVNEYGMSAGSIAPLLRSLEYMHTASLIFDDLPSQDNASTRRGRPTLHRIHDSATAELTGLFMIQKAIEEQSSLTAFDPKTVLNLIQYSSRKAADMCRGQEMDLRARGQALTVEQLNTLCYYKTGIAFEASLVMPAILAKAEEKEIATLTKYAYHAGIAFQIKDDLLDAEGNTAVLGKPAGQDIGNKTSTFVTLYGKDGAAMEMWEHFCLATEALNELPRNSVFLKNLLHYLIGRES
ncbi:polyprenyl synthetase family protein [Paenibacillus sp. LHD-117]|uniref:polyprenyl synthetase family protein n=1 Tax=Paenibacillus sp. LHD-117 TaxID=3071412 RepID=UPI0027E00E49|nr:polyprenyl synthetase family protein [Paenibacillus sp. LHD-117]MDQ6421701.1 polyprenyl synthetase family protein [Paenibacillus sp. LHD-117]